MSERVPRVVMRDIRVAFGGVHAVDGVTIDLFPAKWSASWAGTVQARPP